MSGDILNRIDAAMQANLCGCGCGQQIPARGPSPDFINEKHQQAWAQRGHRASGGRIAADWYDELRRTSDSLIEEAWRTAPAPTVRRGGIRFHVDGSDCPIPENCSACRDLRVASSCGNEHHDGSSWGCRECTPRHPVYDETPMARVVRETSALRRAINKILGARK